MSEREPAIETASGLVPDSNAGKVASAPPYIDKAEEQTRIRALQLEARNLRHELSKWRHQAEMLEAEQPTQEEEIERLKAEMIHIRDVLDSTRLAGRRHEIEQEYRQASTFILQRSASDAQLHTSDDKGSETSGFTSFPLAGGHHSSIHAQVERCLRERTEQKTEVLSDKVKKLTRVAAAQELLIQQLEKEFIKEEQIRDRKDSQLANETLQWGWPQ